MIAKDSTLIDIAFMVCTALDKADITAVLTGGAATMLYAGDMQPSDDVDFIIRFGADKAANAVMKTLGFSRSGRIFISEATQFTVEFPPGPLAVGSEVIGTWETRKRCDECLYVISAFDAVRDRLCWYFYNDDFSSLAAAVAIASSHDVDVAAIGEWAEREYARSRAYDQIKKAQHFSESLQRYRAGLPGSSGTAEL